MATPIETKFSAIEAAANKLPTADDQNLAKNQLASLKLELETTPDKLAEINTRLDVLQ